MDSVMKKTLTTLLLASAFIFSGCKEDNNSQNIIFVTCGDYPPFEYLEQGKLTGFDIELAEALSKELGKETHFENMPFGSLLAALQSKQGQVAISTLTVTDERKQSFDFSDPYYKESISVVFPQGSPIDHRDQLSGKKISCQMGTTTQIWLSKNVPGAHVVLFDNNNQVIEALKAGHVDAALLDGAQGVVFAKKNQGLAHKTIAVSDTGYSLAFPKGSPLKDAYNGALKTLKEKGVLQALTQKWLS